MSAPDLVVFGHLLTDDVVFGDGRTRMAEPGGAALYFSLAASLWGLRVGVVSRRGVDYPRRVLARLEDRDIDLSGVGALEGPGVRNWILYEGHIRNLVHHLASPPLRDVTPRWAEMPPAWSAARAFHVAPMPADLQHDLLRHLSTVPALLSVDPYVLVTGDTWRTAVDLAAAADVFLLSEDELLVPYDRDNPAAALEPVWNGRVRHLALKQGERGGWLREQGGWRRWEARAAGVVDATGAGDAFAAGFLAGLLAGEKAERGVQRGIVAASFAIAAWGATGLLEATPEQAAARFNEWFPA